MLDIANNETLALWLLLVILTIVTALGFGVRAIRRSKAQHRRGETGADETVYSTLGNGGHGEVLDIDPLHEAEVYAAYGNKETALKVLVKASALAPEREDIRAKIAELTST